MSPPDTNVETQGKRHKGPLSGMPLAIILACVAFLAVLGWMALNDTEPRDETVPEVSAGGTDG